MFDLDGIENAIDIAVGSHGGCVLLAHGNVECWGSAEPGHQGDASGENDATRRRDLKLPEAAVDVAVSDTHACAVLDDGRVFCLGVDDYGEVTGEPHDISSRRIVQEPIAVAGIHDAVKVALNMDRTCVLHRSGSVTCFGFVRGGPGVGDIGRSVVRGIDDVVDLVSSRVATCAVGANASLRCWGLSTCGSIAEDVMVRGEDGCSVQHVTAPVSVEGFTTVRNVGMDEGATCVIDGNSEVWCRGWRWDDGLGFAVSGPEPYRVRL
jgi:alpha-tubulin suppressor-like RCC1 family protein